MLLLLDADGLHGEIIFLTWRPIPHTKCLPKAPFVKENKWEIWKQAGKIWVRNEMQIQILLGLKKKKGWKIILLWVSIMNCILQYRGIAQEDSKLCREQAQGLVNSVVVFNFMRSWFCHPYTFSVSFTCIGTSGIPCSAKCKGCKAGCLYWNLRNIIWVCGLI